MKAMIVRARAGKALHKSAPRRDPRDARFLALLRGKCMRAAAIGALTAAAETLPGLGKTLSLVFGELLDAEMLAATQRELIEETFRLYDLRMPARLQDALLRKVQFVGAGASVAGDAFTRGLLRRGFARLGSAFARRAVPLAAVASSAFANAATTYAIGQRARAVARLGEAPIGNLADAVRAFTGVDERRITAWSLGAIKHALAGIGAAAKKLRGTRRNV
jgi:hypothetical protein